MRPISKVSTFLSSLGLLGIIVSLKISLVPSGRYFNTQTHKNWSVLDKDNLAHINFPGRSSIYSLQGARPPLLLQIQLGRLLAKTRQGSQSGDSSHAWGTCVMTWMKKTKAIFLHNVSLRTMTIKSFIWMSLDKTSLFLLLHFLFQAEIVISVDSQSDLIFNCSPQFSLPKRIVTFSQTELVFHEILNLKKLVE